MASTSAENRPYIRCSRSMSRSMRFSGFLLGLVPVLISASSFSGASPCRRWNWHEREESCHGRISSLCRSRPASSERRSASSSRTWLCVLPCCTASFLLSNFMRIVGQSSKSRPCPLAQPAHRLPFRHVVQVGVTDTAGVTDFSQDQPHRQQVVVVAVGEFNEHRTE